MEQQQNDSLIKDSEPFEIVHNARKNSKHLKSTASKSRKNSTISLVDQKQKKIKKKPRKLTDYLEGSDQNLSSGFEPLQKNEQNQDNMFMQTIFGFEDENIMRQQKLKQQKEEIEMIEKQQKQQEEFYFQDCEGEKGIMQGIADQNSLVGQFKFDFFNPEKYSRG